VKLLALDPSSTAVGYAVLTGPEPRVLLEAGVCRPRRVRDAVNRRLESLALEVERLLEEHAPHVVVIEDTSGKVGRKRHGGGGAGLAVYGKAVGYLLCFLEERSRLPGRLEVVPVEENTWTRGVPKRARLAAVAATYSAYRPDKDPGGDAGDAIALAEWWFTERTVRMARQEGAAR
jgi:hypothetical protein